MVVYYCIQSCIYAEQQSSFFRLWSLYQLDQMDGWLLLCGSSFSCHCLPAQRVPERWEESKRE